MNTLHTKAEGAQQLMPLIWSLNICAVMDVLNPQCVLSQPQCPGRIKLQDSGVEVRSQPKRGRSFGL